MLQSDGFDELLQLQPLPLRERFKASQQVIIDALVEVWARTRPQVLGI